MRVVVIGGRGFYGARVVQAVAALPGVEVAVAGRRGPVVVDLGGDVSALDDYDAVVNASDSVGAPPDAAVARVLGRGGVWLEMGADTTLAERLLATGEVGDGVLVVGVGIFPGMSTALAGALADEATERLELGVRLSPLSGAGKGNCALMAAMFAVPGFHYEAGRRVEGGVMGHAVELPFPGRTRSAARVALPDTPLMHRMAPDATVSSHMSLSPGILTLGFRFADWLAQIAGPLRGALVWSTEIGMRLLRGLLFRWRTSPVDLVVVADRGTDRARSRTLSVDDGFMATAQGVAAAVKCLGEGRPAPGVYSAPGAFGAEALLAAFEAVRRG